METTQPHTLNFTGVLSSTKRILSASYIHYLTLSLFSIPLYFSLTTLRHHLPDDPPNHQNLLILYILYTLIAHALTLCAIGTITYSTHHAFFGQPVNLSDALKSLISSFFPLASTAIAAYVLILLISVTFLMFVGTVLMLVHSLGFVIDYYSTHFMWFSAIVGVVLIAIIVYVYVEWSLALVVVVVESKWGFAPLMRSSYLIKGMRSVSLFVMLCFGVFGAFVVWMCSSSVYFVMLGAFFLMIFLLRIAVTNTVLYNYCKALHGELAIEVADQGFTHEYVNFPADDEKVTHVVGVVAA